MDGSVWQRWLGGLLIILITISVGLVAMRWMDSSANGLPHPMETSLKADYQAIRDKPDSVGGNWLRTLNPSMNDVQGDLIWNSKQQEGVMRFINLPAPKRNQRYRLWIHDTRSVDGKPILGAELEAGSGKQELLAAIIPQKSVKEPFKFVLTMGEADHKQPDSQIMLMVQP